MSVWLVASPPRVMATSASTTTTRMAAAMRTAAVGSRPKIRRDSVVRGDAAMSPSPLGEPGFTSVTVVDELEDGLGAGDGESSALGAVAALDELSDVCARAAGDPVR